MFNVKLSPFNYVWSLFASLILVLSFFRVSLSLLYSERVETADAFHGIITGGLRIDASSAGYLSFIFMTVLFTVMAMPITKKYFDVIARFLFTSIISIVIFLELATPAFIEQYDVRPNQLFVEYLIYPKEVFSMLLEGHLLEILLVFSLTALLTTAIWRKSSLISLRQSPRSNKLSFVVLTTISILSLFIAARGTFQHRPLNPSSVYFSNDSLVNSLTLNSLYSVIHAADAMTDVKSAEHFYGTMSTEEMLTVIANSSPFEVSGTFPNFSRSVPVHKGPPKNLVVIVEESLGARFVSKLGGRKITPSIDAIIDEGWAFMNMYATGIRSVRGLEAILTGFPPSPSRSVVKLPNSQTNFFTLGNLLKDKGYNTQFIYGGESHFDNMKSFFLGNGFTDIVDFDDIETPEYVASWGASDEDLFNQADKELIKLNNKQSPFFSFIFTSSNHDPFDIPDGKVSLDDNYVSDNIKRDLAIKYADFALGKFIDRAKTRSYWDNTVFLIVADHDVRVFGSEPVPIKSYHIPAIILNSGKQPTKDYRLTSQIDLPKTLLSLIGAEAITPLIGFDLNNGETPERAMMQYYSNYAYIEGSKALILQPGGKSSIWHYDKTTKSQSETSVVEEALYQRAKAHALLPNFLYENLLYSNEPFMKKIKN